MKKRIILTLAGLGVLIAILAAVKGLQILKMVKQAKTSAPPPTTVTSAPIRSDTWQASATAVGTLKAVQGVTVAAQLSGKVVAISFQSGARVEKGEVLIRQDASSEKAQLPGAVAQANLARANLERARKLWDMGIIARVDVDSAVANAGEAQAAADNIRSGIEKKTIRAPFSGRLGIRQVDLGQMLREGDPVVTLQTLDPIYVDFTLPQQDLRDLRQGLSVEISGDAFPGPMKGRITAVNPLVDPETRNVRVEATLSNPSGRLRPGMFVNVKVGLPTYRSVLVIPATGVLYAPYGNSVFVIEDNKEGGVKLVRQAFVRLGERRGDFVEITGGLKEGETIVSTGVFKLRNGESVTVDNTLSPKFETSPTPENR